MLAHVDSPSSDRMCADDFWRGISQRISSLSYDSQKRERKVNSAGVRSRTENGKYMHVISEKPRTEVGTNL